MIILTPIAFLLFTTLAMLLLRWLRPRFSYFWLVAAFGALLNWIAGMYLRSQIPTEFTLVTWGPAQLFPVSPILQLDEISWPFVISLATLALAVVLTDVVRAAGTRWPVWAGSLSICALGIFAVMAGNTLTLLLAWAAIDLAEFLLLIFQIPQSEIRERIVLAFSARVAGIMLLIAAGISSQVSGGGLDFTRVTPQTNLLFISAAGLRLGVLPLHVPFLEDDRLRHGLGTILRLVPAAASLVLLARVAPIGGPKAALPFLNLLAGLAALYGGISWLNAANELDGRPFWILGGTSLAVVATLNAQPAASLAWGITTLMAGGLIFLTSVRNRRLLLLPLLGVLATSMLPFTPTWPATRLYSPGFTAISFIFLLSQSLLLVGYLRHALRMAPHPGGLERWVWLIYPLGLALLPAILFLVGYWNGSVPQEMGRQAFVQAWPTIAILTLSGIFIAAWKRGLRLPPSLVSSLQRFFSFDWFYRFVWGVYQQVSRVVDFLNLIQEGEGGILWTLLLLTLLLSLLIERGLGV
jgi:hypothetical protein